MDFLVDPNDLHHSGNDPVYLTPVGFTVFILELLIQHAEIHNMLQVALLFPGKKHLVSQATIRVK